MNVFDFHQHSPFAGRSHEGTLEHQRRMGVERTVLLSAGSERGLQVSAGSNDDLLAMVREHPAEYCFFANERPDRLDAVRILEKYLRLGATGIGEQKFHVDCDSVYIDGIAEVARSFRVPVLFHFEFDQYNTGFERFHKLLERHPEVNFVGHAQTWWGNIDREHKPWIMHPRGPVTAGGITDRLLSDYPNVYGDLSANSGLNALQRDEGHARDFLLRHQDRLLYGSDCADSHGQGTGCTGSQILAAVKRLVTDQAVLHKILYSNAEKLLER